MADTVLITRFSALGDVAMTVPVVYSACRCYPERTFVFVTRKAMTSIFVDAPSNLTIAGVDIDNDYHGLPGLKRLATELYSQYRPAIMIDLHNVLRTKLLAVFFRLKGVRVSVLEKPRAARRAIVKHQHGSARALRPQTTLYAEAFARGGLPVHDMFSGLYNGRCSADETLFAAITAPKKPAEKWIGIAPFAAHPGKIYPIGQMEKVVALIQQQADREKNIKVFLFGGGKSEQAVLDNWADTYSCATSLAGKKYGFKVELALFNYLDAVVSMDSANMHLASLAGAPVVSVWGATHSSCGFRPWHQPDDNMIELALECRPCSIYGNKACRYGDLRCLARISPEVIYNKIAQITEI